MGTDSVGRSTLSQEVRPLVFSMIGMGAGAGTWATETSSRRRKQKSSSVTLLPTQ